MTEGSSDDAPDESACHSPCSCHANGARLTHGGRSGTTFIGSEGILHIDRGRIASIPEAILEAAAPNRTPMLLPSSSEVLSLIHI